MKTVSITDNINYKKIRGLGDKKTKLYAQNTFYKSMFDFVPFDTGELAETVNITPEYVHFKAPHAHRMYTGDDFNFSTERHPLATARWDYVAWEVRGDTIKKDIEKYIKWRVKNGK